MGKRMLHQQAMNPLQFFFVLVPGKLLLCLLEISLKLPLSRGQQQVMCYECFGSFVSGYPSPLKQQENWGETMARDGGCQTLSY